MRVLIFIFILQSTLAAAANPPRVIWNVAKGSVRSKALVAQLDWNQFQIEAMKFLSPPFVRAGTLLVYSSESDRVKAAPQDGTDCEYGGWQAALEYGGWQAALQVRGMLGPSRPCPEVSQAVKIGTAIRMRRIGPDCQMRRNFSGVAAGYLQFRSAGLPREISDVIVHRAATNQAIV